jgi:hypothetical protein
MSKPIWRHGGPPKSAQCQRTMGARMSCLMPRRPKNKPGPLSANPAIALDEPPDHRRQTISRLCGPLIAHRSHPRPYPLARLPRAFLHGRRSSRAPTPRSGHAELVAHSSRERRETSRNDGNGWSIESAGQQPDSSIDPGSEIGSENTLKVETRVRTPLGLRRPATVFRSSEGLWPRIGPAAYTGRHGEVFPADCRTSRSIASAIVPG